MKIRILRFERSQNASGKEEIFMMIEVNTGTGVYTRAEWLTDDEISLINDDETYKNTISQEMADRAILINNMQQSQL